MPEFSDQKQSYKSRRLIEIAAVFCAAVLLGLWLQSAYSPQTDAGVSSQTDESANVEPVAANDDQAAPSVVKNINFPSTILDEDDMVQAGQDPLTQDIATTQYRLAVAYEKGYGVPQNYKIAAVWYKSAADLGHKIASYNLGIFYFKGLGVDKNYATAAQWFQKSVDQSFAKAAYNLGFMYEEGLGVKRDMDKAYDLYVKAAAGGVEAAQARVKMLESRLNKKHLIDLPFADKKAK